MMQLYLSKIVVKFKWILKEVRFLSKLNNQKFANLPNVISFLALFLSWIGIILLLNKQFYFSFAIILIAFILDAFDGFLARKLEQETDFGRYLDSHVDVFIYLLYPALCFYFFFELKDVISLIVIFIYLAAGILRLVRFNLTGFLSYSDKNYEAYSGLPVFFNHLPLLVFLILKLYEIKYFCLATNIIILVNSILMLSKFPFPKPKNIWPFVILLLLLSCMMAYLGIYASY